MTRHFWSAVFLQFMGTVGSGIFVLPYLFARSNFLFSVLGLIFLALVTAALNYFYVEIVLSTPGDHQLAGYTKIYLHSKLYPLAVINLFLLSFGAILAYYLLFTAFFRVLVPGISSLLPTVLFLLSLVIFFLNRTVLDRKYFFLVPVFMLLIPLILFLFAIPLPVSGIFPNVYPNFGFFGATIFALSGFTIIPEVREIFGESLPTRRRLSLAVLIGLLLTTLIYFFYAYSVLILSNGQPSVDSVAGLAVSLPVLAKIISLFGIVVTLRASYGFLLILRELFYRDLRISLPVSNLLPLLFPILVIFLKSVSLISIISLTGHITIFISAILICLVRLKLPHTFAHRFFALLILITLSLGLLVNL